MNTLFKALFIDKGFQLGPRSKTGGPIRIIKKNSMGHKTLKLIVFITKFNAPYFVSTYI